MKSRPLWPGQSQALFGVALAVTVAMPAVLHDRAKGIAREMVSVAVADSSGDPGRLVVTAKASPTREPAGRAPEEDFRRFASIIERASRAYGVDAALVRAVILVESSYDPDALSPAGASGLMQLMPETARSYGVKDLFDPHENIHAGVKCLSDLLQQFGGDVELALAAYNAGPTAVIRAGHRIPQYPETLAYVPKVIDNYQRFRAIKG